MTARLSPLAGWRRDGRWLFRLLAFPLRLRHPLQILCLLAALVIVPSFWRQAEPEQSDPELTAMTRMELSYFVSLVQVARELPPASVPPAVAAEHGQTYPRLPLLLHAAAWRWGGLPGLISADVLVTILTYCLWCAVFRLLTGHPAVALLGGAAIINGAAAALLAGLRAAWVYAYYASPRAGKALLLAAAASAVLAALGQARRRGPLTLWLRATVAFLLAGAIVALEFAPGFAGIELFRFPRPLVTSLISNLWLLALLMAWRRPKRRLPEILIGLTAGLALQSDIYSFSALALVSAGAWLLRGKFNVRSLLAAGVPFAVAVAPFGWRQLAVAPEMRVRMGLEVFPVAAVWQVTREVTGPYWVLGLALLAVLAAALLRQPRQPRQTLLVVGGMVFAMAAAPAFLAGVAGQAAQFSHYRALVPQTFALFVWCVLLTMAGPLLRPVPASSARPAGWALALLCGAGAWWLPVTGSAYGGTTFPRRDLVALVRELRQPRYAACQVLGTWQPEVRAWWLAFRGDALNPDPFATNLPEPQLEERVLRLAQLQEMPPADFTALLRRAGNVPTAFWQLGHFKYHVWRWYTLAPWSDYSRPEADEDDDFMLPDSTVARIAARLPETVPPLRCDVIVREPPADDPERAPRGYRLTYRSAHYQVFLREALTGGP